MEYVKMLGLIAIGFIALPILVVILSVVGVAVLSLGALTCVLEIISIALHTVVITIMYWATTIGDKLTGKTENYVIAFAGLIDRIFIS